MKELIEIVNKLKDSEVREVVEKRMKEFDDVMNLGEKEIFRELCFCILTAGTSAELGLKTIDHIGDVIFNGNEKDIQKKLKECYRFHTLRAGYIHNARDSFKGLDIHDENIREDLVRNIKGIGMKEASHFLRNIGMKDYAIIDFHIVDLLVRNGLIEKPKTITPKRYIEIEGVLKGLAEETGTSLGELDLYLWYEETGKILK